MHAKRPGKTTKKLKITEQLDIERVQESRHSKPGRPVKDAQPDRPIVRITGTPATRLLPLSAKTGAQKLLYRGH